MIEETEPKFFQPCALAGTGSSIGYLDRPSAAHSISLKLVRRALGILVCLLGPGERNLKKEGCQNYKTASRPASIYPSTHLGCLSELSLCERLHAIVHRFLGQRLDNTRLASCLEAFLDSLR